MAEEIVQTTTTLLDEIIERARGDDDRDRIASEVGDLAAELLKDVPLASKRADRAIQERIDAIDAMLSEQLAEVLHHSEFQELEGTWRGLKNLCANTNSSPTLQIKVMNVDKQTLNKDLVEDATNFDQTWMWKKVYSEEFDQFGGHPFSALIGDYEWSYGPQDCQLLTEIAQVAAAAHAPFISAVSADTFGLKSMTELNTPPDLASVFSHANYTDWNAFRDHPDSRYVGMVMPRVMARLPYGKDTTPVKAFNFEEGVDGSNHDYYCWSNACYAYAGRLTEAFNEYGWTVRIRGVQGGGLVDALPIHNYENAAGEIVSKCPTEVQIPDSRENELSKLGLMPLLHSKRDKFAAFISGESVHRPKTNWDTDEANANERLSSRIPYLMAIARFSHYLKSMCRDWLGDFGERADVEVRLNRWIANYVLLDDTADPVFKAKKPLREARVDVQDDPARPGCYSAQLFLRPHFQVEEVDAALSLVASLPTPAPR